MVGPPSLPGGEEAACWPRGAVVSAFFWLKLSLWRGDGAGWWAVQLHARAPSGSTAPCWRTARAVPMNLPQRSPKTTDSPDLRRLGVQSSMLCEMLTLKPHEAHSRAGICYGCETGCAYRRSWCFTAANDTWEPTWAEAGLPLKIMQN